MTIPEETDRALRAYFPPNHHRVRDLPGGGYWIYVPWQFYRDRLDKLVPDWQVYWSHPKLVGEHTSVICGVTICGISREGLGDALLVLLSKEGKDMARGSPIQRARAAAWKEAMQQFGIGSYLDSQKEAARYLSEQGGTGDKKSDANLKSAIAKYQWRFEAPETVEQKCERVRVARQRAGLDYESVKTLLKTQFSVESPRLLSSAQIDRLVAEINQFAQSVQR